MRIRALLIVLALFTAVPLEAQQILHQRGTISSGNGTQYWPPAGGFANTTTVLVRAEGIAPAAGVMRDLRVEAGSALAGSEQLVIALLVNGSPSSLTVTLDSSNQVATDTTNDVSIATDDTLAWRVVGTNNPTVTALRIAFEFDATTANLSIGGYGGFAAGLLLNTGYTGAFYGTGAWLAADAGWNLIATPGTITAHTQNLSNAPGSGDSRTFVLRKNGVDQDGTGGTPDTRVTISDTATTDTATFSLSVVSGDEVQVKDTISGTPDNSYGTGMIAFVATQAGRWNVGSTNQQNPSTSATTYQYVYGPNGTYSATEGDRELLNGPTAIWLSGFRLKGIAPTSGKSWTLTLRKNAGATGQSVTMANSATTASDFGETVEIAAGDEFAMQTVPSGTPVTPSDLRWAFVGSLTDPGPGEGGAESGFNALLIVGFCLAAGSWSVRRRTRDPR